MHINSFMNYCQLWTYCISSSIIASFALQVTEGERLTLTLWFTRDHTNNEVPKLLTFFSLRHHWDLNQLSKNLIFLCEPLITCIGFPVINLALTYDVLECMSLAFKFHSSSGEYSTSVLPDEENPIEMFGKQLRPVRGDDIFEKMFSSSLHALQVSLIFWVASKSAVWLQYSVTC